MQNKKRLYFVISLVIIFLVSFFGSYYYLNNYVYLKAADTQKEWFKNKEVRFEELLKHTNDENNAMKLLIEERINFIVSNELKETQVDAAMIDLKTGLVDIDLVLLGEPSKEKTVKTVTKYTEHVIKRVYESFSGLEDINVNWKNHYYEKAIIDKWKEVLKEKKIAYDPKYFKDTNYIAKFTYNAETKEIEGSIDEYFMTKRNRKKFDYVPMKEEEKIKSLEEYYEEWIEEQSEK